MEQWRRALVLGALLVIGAPGIADAQDLPDWLKVIVAFPVVQRFYCENEIGEPAFCRLLAGGDGVRFEAVYTIDERASPRELSQVWIVRPGSDAQLIWHYGLPAGCLEEDPCIKV